MQKALFYCSLDFVRSVAICRHESGKCCSFLLFLMHFLDMVKVNLKKNEWGNKKLGHLPKNDLESAAEH